MNQETNREQGLLWDGAELQAMDDYEKMDEDKEETEIGSEVQEEEHQKERAIAGLNFPSRREVEDHNVIHSPFRSWCNHCSRGRERRSAHKRRHNEGKEWTTEL